MKVLFLVLCRKKFILQCIKVCINGKASHRTVIQRLESMTSTMNSQSYSLNSITSLCLLAASSYDGSVNIRGLDYKYHILYTRISCSGSGYPPWILKRDGLESSGQRLISSIAKTNKIKFFLGKKNIFKFSDFLKKMIFFSSDFRIFDNFFWVCLWIFFLRFFVFSVFFLYFFLFFWIFWIFLDFSIFFF